MLWSSFRWRWKGVPLKPLSRIWEQRQHSQAPARETGCNVMLAQDPDSCYDLKHNLFRVWPAPTVNNHTHKFEFQLQDECNVQKGGQNGVVLTKTFFGAAKLCRRLVAQWGGFFLGAKVKKQVLWRSYLGGFCPIFMLSLCRTDLHGCRLSFNSFLPKPVRSGDLLSTLGFCCTEQCSVNKRRFVYLLLG